MAKKKDKEIDVSGKTFKTGVNIRTTADDPQGVRFEKGDALPADLTADELKALTELDAIEG